MFHRTLIVIKNFDPSAMCFVKILSISDRSKSETESHRPSFFNLDLASSQLKSVLLIFSDKRAIKVSLNTKV